MSTVIHDQGVAGGNMIRILGAGLLLAGLGGCAAPADGAWWRDLAGLSSAPGVYRFDWRISGDPALAPLQIFDDGRETWLQYPADQPAPAVFERTARGDRLLRPRRDRDYLILRGVPERIVLRGGLSQAEAWRETGTSSTPQAEAMAVPSARDSAHGVDTPVAHLPMPLPSPRPPPPPPLPPAPSAPAASARARALSFEVTPADGNVRRALGRWAQTAGWTFEPEHWDVDVDIPLAGSAVFGDSFRTAVRGLLSATELGDRPVQPCFYANRVLRVVPLAQRCDRTQVPGVAS
ncbi:TcpQ domain-containing protein [Castellaniella sp.]|uniref:TcpQ domain-containing protein n=4 Tax=Castellaniella sp. TaxID=1955812 RepID=UPI003C720767